MAAGGGADAGDALWGSLLVMSAERSPMGCAFSLRDGADAGRVMEAGSRHDDSGQAVGNGKAEERCGNMRKDFTIYDNTSVCFMILRSK